MSIENIVLISIIIGCIIFIGICVIKKRPDLLVNFGLRAIVGTAGVYLLDFILRVNGYDINVGINGVSILTNGLLGLPGFLLLYGLAIYYTF
ncbi:MAG TPA: pro-sigmaK processing inhibitor BofA family protein [Mobilitalea sp.]|nr:pro-sigmaK processing inhibitor BofA family protein [Mobilitalea sp.]